MQDIIIEIPDLLPFPHYDYEQDVLELHRHRSHMLYILDIFKAMLMGGAEASALYQFFNQIKMKLLSFLHLYNQKFWFNSIRGSL